MRAPRRGSPPVGVTRGALQYGRFWKKSEISKRIHRVAPNSHKESCAARITVAHACHCGSISLFGPKVRRPLFFCNRERESIAHKRRCRCPPGPSRLVASIFHRFLYLKNDRNSRFAIPLPLFSSI